MGAKMLDSLNVSVPGMSESVSLGLFSPALSEDTFSDEVWPGLSQLEQRTPLIRHYQRCCNAAFVCGEPVATQSNSDIVMAVEVVKANNTPSAITKMVVNRIHSSHDSMDCAVEDQKIAEHLVTIAFMITFMCQVSFGHVRPKPTNLNLRQLAWSSDETPKALLEVAFPKTNNLDGKGRLPRTFHARNLERLGSIQVVWTSNLLDHLRLHDPLEQGRPYTVSIFHYAQFLQANENSDIFPPGLVSETLRTLALLLPGHVGGTRGWFQKQQRFNKDLDMNACFCTFSDNENRTIQSFNYWRDRLTILKQTYDESEPKSVWQWWNDGRKRERWATFWVAIIVLCLTIFFGVVQTVEGALQVYKAYHPS